MKGIIMANRAPSQWMWNWSLEKPRLRRREGDSQVRTS